MINASRPFWGALSTSGIRPAAERGAVVPRRDWRALLVTLVAVDALAMALATLAAGLLRLQLDELLPVVSLGAPERHVVASILAVPLLLVLFRLHGLYDSDRILAGTREYAQIAHAATYGVLITLASSYFAGGSPLVSRSWLLLVWLLTIASVGGARFAARRVVRRLRQRGVLRTRVVIVGASTFGVTIAEQLRAATNEGIDVVGFLDEYLPIGQPLLDDIRVLGRPGDLVHQGRVHAADEYVLVPQALPHERVEEIAQLSAAREELVLRIAVSSSDLLTHGVRVAERGSVPLIALTRARLGHFEGVLKGSLEIGVAAAALLLLTPLALAAAVRSVAKGHRPLLARHVIYTTANRHTTLWLFDDAVTTWAPLRGVPALLAVLGGRLSLVGPRPIEWNQSEPDAPRAGLSAVRPGLTGAWRLSGPSATLDDQALQDLTYVRNYSIWEDVRILWASAHRLATRSSDDTRLGRWRDPPRRS